MSSITDPETSLEPVEYLARSPSRFELLDAIYEDTRTRHDLKELTDVSRVTLSRFLSTFEERGWIERTNGQYDTTVEGAFVAEEVSRLLTNVETFQSLDGAIEWMPIDKFDFDLACLQDAEVTTATWKDHTAQMRQVANVIHGSNRIRATASGTSREVVDALWDATVEQGASFQAVFDDTVLGIIRSDSVVFRKIEEMAGHDAEFFRYNGPETPLIMLMICDDLVLMCGHDMEGPPPGTIQTDDDRVLAWAESYFEEVLNDAISADIH